MMFPTKTNWPPVVHLLLWEEPKRADIDIHQRWVEVADPQRCSEKPTTPMPQMIHPHHISGTSSGAGHCGWRMLVVAAHLRDWCEPREFLMEADVVLDFAGDNSCRQEEEDLHWPSL
jgi:hypothetical protein